MKEIFEEFIRIQDLDDLKLREAKMKEFFNKLNHMPLPEYFNWEDEIFEGLHCNERPNQEALIWVNLDNDEVRSFTYKECKINANKFLNFMREHNVKKGDSIYQMIPNIPEMWFTTLAALRGGIIAIPTAMTMKVNDLKYRFEVYPPDIVLAHEDVASVIDQALREAGKTPKVKIVIGKGEKGWISYDEASHASEYAEPAKTNARIDPAFCFFTSGTVALPKRVLHTNLSYPVGHLSTAAGIGVRPGWIHNNLSAPGWAKWAWSNFFSPLNVGATTSGFYWKGSLNYEKYLEYIAKIRVNSFCAPPTAWRRIIKLNLEEITSKYDFGALKELISAGEPLNPEIIQIIKKHFGIVVRDCYGQTETTLMIGNFPWHVDRVKPGSFGFPSFMYDIILVDDEGREITTPNQEGHIVVRLNKWRPIGLFIGYMGEPERDKEVFRGNYYYTGDKAMRDEDGYLWFIGRADDVIKSSDYRIGPFEVESALLEHPAVAESAVIGVPHPEYYQIIKAFVVLRAGYEASADMAKELFKHCIKILPKFKVPRIIEFVSTLPLSTGQKIRRSQLRKEEEERLRKGQGRREKEYFYTDFPELKEMK
ncbi:MAG: AMP-binding protein [Thermoproteota archaeon]|jgi:acyl-coenzyme A synthetase/AMP-(fatty) acid ligase|nr:AMP-binding protein [Thermoproteota archaeon]